ncbi:translation initiation factor IF-2 [Rahnella woolbedingensis]|uniref:Translation initiation factor IF-2 n=1 Tax=Rahnella woolbedingensis TaxID=1510574 RepID=A0A419NA04_9GAMM|nr:translation initiation factor IF-2 [Rahnella woolbedingensis]
MPGIIRSFDPETVTCDVDIAIIAKLTKPGTVSEDCQYESVRYPILTDLPVIFPRGGGVTLTFPLKEGDECLIVFSSRSIDFWWQNGGVQERADSRVLDISDAFVIPGPQSQTKKISGISTSAVQLRTDDAGAYVELNPGNHAINLKTSGNLTAQAAGSITVTAPTITLNGDVTINGNLSQGMGDGGGAATMLGPITVTNDVTAGGKSLQNHVHSGVQTGSGQTGKPQ